VEEVFDPAFIADEAETFVDQQPSDGPGWHNPCPPMHDTP
jgi:hypothetical protein